MQVVVKVPSYKDMELNRSVKQGEVLTVTKERGEYLIARQLVNELETAKVGAKKTKKSKKSK